MAQVVASNGNTVQIAGLEDSQVNAIMMQTRAQADRLTNALLSKRRQLEQEIFSYLIVLNSAGKSYSLD